MRVLGWVADKRVNPGAELSCNVEPAVLPLGAGAYWFPRSVSALNLIRVPARLLGLAASRKRARLPLWSLQTGAPRPPSRMTWMCRNRGLPAERAKRAVGLACKDRVGSPSLPAQLRLCSGGEWRAIWQLAPRSVSCKVDYWEGPLAGAQLPWQILQAPPHSWQRAHG